jgi:hypothetical protein
MHWKATFAETSTRGLVSVFGIGEAKAIVFCVLAVGFQ